MSTKKSMCAAEQAHRPGGFHDIQVEDVLIFYTDGGKGNDPHTRRQSVELRRYVEFKVSREPAAAILMRFALVSSWVK